MTIVERYNGDARPSDFGRAEITVSGIVNPNNGTLLLSDSTAKAFRLRPDGFVFVYGREEQRTVLKVDIGAIDDMLAAISNDTRKTLAIETNTTITVSAGPAPGKIQRIAILPTPETLERLPSELSLFDSILKPYLSEHKPALHHGDDLTICHSEQQFHFKVDMIVVPYNDPYGIITNETVVHCEGTTTDVATVEVRLGPPEESGRSSGLLSNGADPNASDRYGPAITQAIREGREWLAIELLRNGANPNASDRYGPAITQAIREGREWLAIELLRNGADPNASDRYGPAITQAIREGLEWLAIELLRNGANPNASDRYGSAITQAIREGREWLAIELLRNGADPNASDRYGPAITQAIEQNLQALLIELLRKSSCERPTHCADDGLPLGLEQSPAGGEADPDPETGSSTTMQGWARDILPLTTSAEVNANTHRAGTDNAGQTAGTTGSGSSELGYAAKRSHVITRLEDLFKPCANTDAQHYTGPQFDLAAQARQNGSRQISGHFTDGDLQLIFRSLRE